MPRLEQIFIAPRAGAPSQACDSAVAVAGRGLRGDRYYHGRGTFSRRAGVAAGAREISVIAAEAIERCNQRLGVSMDAGAFRRNLVVADLGPRPRPGTRLAIGDVVLEVVSTCPPCGILARHWGLDARAGLRGMGGVRARGVVGGRLVRGAPVHRSDAL